MKISNKNQGVIAALIVMLLLSGNVFSQRSLTFPIVDTDQEIYYDTILEISEPMPGEAFYGQDANYDGNQPSYQDNGDGTITDLVTGLMWVKTPDMDNDGDIDVDDKMSYEESIAAADTFSLAGYNDWRLPSIKEMYSLIVFSGLDPSGYEGTSTDDLVPFIDTDYFDFAYGDLNAGERIIDAQMASTNIYVGSTMMEAETMFGVNFADGRIKGYGTGPMPGQTQDKQFYVMYVRGNTDYGINNLVDNSDGTITDESTGLMWTQDDNGEGLLWEDALNHAENYSYAGHSDWRLPNVKELQGILDYTRSPSTSNSAAIDPLFNCSQITDEGGNINYPFYWSGTTHANWQENAQGGAGAYVCFGEALGFMEEPPMSGNYQLMDVHGAGAQRSDPKVGNPDDYPNGNGPQGDVVRIYNYVRLVRDITATGVEESSNDTHNIQVYPNPVNDMLTVSYDIDNETNESILIYNVNGQLVYNNNITSENDLKIDVSNLKSGLYILSITSNNKTSQTHFIK